ncbi:MAG: hypothetical protein WD941_04095 [Opitutus sp.]
MDRPWKVIFAFVAVFMAGAVFGGLFTLRASGKRFATAPFAGGKTRIEKRAVGAPSGTSVPGAQAGGIAPAMMRQFAHRLNLTPEQREKISPVLGRAAEDWQRLRRENVEGSTRVNERMYGDVAALLTPGQRVELEIMRKQMRERIRNAREKIGAPSDGARRPGEPSPNGPRSPGR